MSQSKWIKGSIILALSGILSRILGLGRDAVLSRVGGLSLEVDAYNLAFLIPDLLNHFLGAGLLSVTLIPLLAPAFKEKNEEEASRVLSSIFGVIFGVITVLSVLIFWRVEWVLEFGFYQKLSPELMALTARYTRIVLFGQVFFLAGGFFNAWQYARYNYTFPAFTPLIYNGAIIVGGLASLGTGSVEGFCWGVLVGAFLGAGVLQFIGSRKTGLRLRWAKPGVEFKRYLFLTAPFAVGASMTFSNEFLFRFVGGGNPGDVAALGYGLRITMALVGVFGGTVGIAAYPYLAELCAKKEYAKVNESVISTIRGISVILIPSLFMMAVFAPVLIDLYLGQRGLGPEGVQKVTTLTRCYLWVALPMSLQLIVSRIWYADQRTWTPALITLVLFGVSLPFYFVFEEWGLERIPLISAATCFFQLLLLFGLWAKKHREGNWQALLRPLVLALAGGALSYFLFALFPIYHRDMGVWTLLFSAFLGCTGLFGQWTFLYLFGGLEVKGVFHRFFKKVPLLKNRLS